MRTFQFMSFLSVSALIVGCGISSTPTKSLTGTASDEVAAAQREALGLGDMAIQDANQLPDLTSTSLDTLSLNVSGLTSLSKLNINNAILTTEKFGVSGDSLLQGTLSVSGLITASGGVTGNLTGNATTSTNLANGSLGTIPYQSSANTTSMLAVGTSGYILQSNGAAAPSWTSQSSLNVGNASNVTGTADLTSLKLTKNSVAPVACTSVIDGRIALTSLYTLCVCDGTTSTWVETSDGSTACSW